MNTWLQPPNLGLLVPTRGRPEKAAELANAVEDTAPDAKLIFVIDYDDPERERYGVALAGKFGTVLTVPEDGPKRMGPVLNWAAVQLTDVFSHIAFMGDDHRPRTNGWDHTLVDILDGKPGVSYANDLNQGEALPTSVVISSEIVKALGYYCPPPCEHLYLDNFWKMLGESVGNLAYMPDVVIEHMHPTVAKGNWDAGYALVNSGNQFARDVAAYNEFLRTQWPGDLSRLLEAL